MSKIRARLRAPSPAIVIAIVALVAALGGSAYAGSKIGFGELSKKAKVKTAGVGPLEYVSTTNTVVPTGPAGQTVFALCPAGMNPISGGIRLSNNALMFVNSDHAITGGWAGRVVNESALNRTATVIVACANSRDVDGPLPSTG